MDEPCIICFESINFENIPILLFCTHLFHLNCLRKWFVLNKICPYCRQPIKITRFKRCCVVVYYRRSRNGSCRNLRYLKPVEIMDIDLLCNNPLLPSSFKSKFMPDKTPFDCVFPDWMERKRYTFYRDIVHDVSSVTGEVLNVEIVVLKKNMKSMIYDTCFEYTLTRNVLQVCDNEFSSIVNKMSEGENWFAEVNKNKLKFLLKKFHSFCATLH